MGEAKRRKTTQGETYGQETRINYPFYWPSLRLVASSLINPAVNLLTLADLESYSPSLIAGWFHTKKEKYQSLYFSFWTIDFDLTSIPLPPWGRGFDSWF